MRKDKIKFLFSFDYMIIVDLPDKRDGRCCRRYRRRLTRWMAGGGGGISGSSGPFVVGSSDVTRAGQLSAAPVGDRAPLSGFI